MEIKMKMETQRVVLPPLVSIPELMQHMVLTHVLAHPRMGDWLNYYQGTWCQVGALPLFLNSVKVDIHKWIQDQAFAIETAAVTQVILGQY